jgi:hypothetical protein
MVLRAFNSSSPASQILKRRLAIAQTLIQLGKPQLILFQYL